MSNRDDSGGGGGGGVDQLEQAFEDLLDAAADKGVEEEPWTDFFVSDADAQIAAMQQARTTAADVATKLTRIAGGYALAVGGRANTDPTLPKIDGYTHNFITRESPIWTNRRAKLAERVKLVRAAVADYEPQRFDAPIAAGRDLCAGLAVRRLGSAEDSLDSVSELSESIGKSLGVATSDNAVWPNIRQLASDAQPMDSEFIAVYKSLYIDQLPNVLAGQSMIAAYLCASLKIAKSAVSHGVSDVKQLLDKTTVALGESGAAGVDINVGTALSAISGALGTASAVMAFSVVFEEAAAVTGLLSAGTGLAATLAADVSIGQSGDSSGEVRVEGVDVSDVIQSLVKAVLRALDAIAAVETSVGAMLRRVSRASENTNAAEPCRRTPEGVHPTVQDCWFRVRPTSSGAIATAAGGAKVPYGFLRIGAETLLADGRDVIPPLADGYRAMAAKAAASGGGVKAALTRQSAFAVGGNDVSALFFDWDELHSKLRLFFDESAVNLDGLGEVLRSAAKHFKETDDENARDIDATRVSDLSCRETAVAR